MARRAGRVRGGQAGWEGRAGGMGIATRVHACAFLSVWNKQETN